MCHRTYSYCTQKLILAHQPPHKQKQDSIHSPIHKHLNRKNTFCSSGITFTGNLHTVICTIII